MADLAQVAPVGRDPTTSATCPCLGPGLQVGQAWFCNQDLSSGYGNTWTWDGQGWTPATSPAGFQARKVIEAAWISGSRDPYVRAAGRAGVLQSHAQLQAELQQRIAAYAARRSEPNAYRQLSQLAVMNPQRADAMLRRAGY